VDSKYGNLWGGWGSNEVHGSYGVGLWKNIRRGWVEFSSHTRFEVGDGFKIRFWHDVLCRDHAVKAAFLELFNLARCKDTSVAHHLKFSSDSSVGS
jgi:hypothetical protein